MTEQASIDTVLYLDDEAINLSGFKFVFRAQYNVLTATTIAEARKYLAEHKIKVIISDQKMPEMSGTDFFKSIADEYPDVIKIILTAYADSDTAIEAINEANIYNFMVKPWKKEKMGQTLRNAVNAFDLVETNTRLIADLKQQNDKITEANDQLKLEIQTRLHTERALIQSERKFRQIFNSSSDGIIIWSRDFRIIDVNKAVEEVLGYSNEELLKMPLTRLISQESNEAISFRIEDLCVGKEMPAIGLEAICRNGTVIPIEVNSRLLSLANSEVILTIVRDVRLRKEKEKAVLDAVVETEERERERFARDLHDDFGPILSSVKMYLRLLGEQDLGDKATGIIGTIGEMVDESIHIVRSTSNALSSHVLVNYGLVQAFEHSVEKFREFSSIDFVTNLTDERFAPNAEAVVFRIFNELLNNTMKHANATLVKLHLLLDAGMLTFYYSDNGDGFDLNQKLNDSKGGIGIFNIFSRIQTIGGKYSFDTAPGEGVKFSLKTKLPPIIGTVHL